jgi:hypothetical protein
VLVYVQGSMNIYSVGNHRFKRDEDKIVPRELDVDDSDVEPRSDDERFVYFLLSN